MLFTIAVCVVCFHLQKCSEVSSAFLLSGLFQYSVQQRLFTCVFPELKFSHEIAHLFPLFAFFSFFFLFRRPKAPSNSHYLEWIEIVSQYLSFSVFAFLVFLEQEIWKPPRIHFCNCLSADSQGLKLLDSAAFVSNHTNSPPNGKVWVTQSQKHLPMSWSDHCRIRQSEMWDNCHTPFLTFSSLQKLTVKSPKSLIKQRTNACFYSSTVGLNEWNPELFVQKIKFSVWRWNRKRKASHSSLQRVWRKKLNSSILSTKSPFLSFMTD